MVKENLQSVLEAARTRPQAVEPASQELRALNTELRERVEELARANADLQSLLSASGAATLYLDASLKVRRFSAAAAQVLGLSEADRGRPFGQAALRIPVDVPQLARDVRRALGTLTTVDRELETGEGEQLILRVHPYFDPRGTVDGAALTISRPAGVREREEGERLQAPEEERRRRSRELDHTVKNTLTMVQGILDQTVPESAHSVKAFARAFRNRLGALSVAHRTGVSGECDGAPLLDVIERTLRPLGEEHRISVRGPSVTLPAFAILPLSMALHELATNAIRHGSLTHPEGRVSIEWTRPREGKRVLLTWTESGGPRVSAPEHTGFGIRLIDRGLPYELGGSSRIEFPSEGLCCEFSIPIEHARDGG